MNVIWRYGSVVCYRLNAYVQRSLIIFSLLHCFDITPLAEWEKNGSMAHVLNKLKTKVKIGGFTYRSVAQVPNN